MHPSHTHASAVAVTTRHLSVPRWRAWSVAVVALFLVALFGVFSAQASATPATLYWSGETAVGSVQVNDATGVIVDNTRNNSVSTGCIGGKWTWGFNSTTYFTRRGADEICQNSLDGSGAASTLLNTNCTAQFEQGVGNGLYATADYVYYACFAHKWIGRVKTDGTESLPHFASIDSTCSPCGGVITGDGNWLYIANSAGEIRRTPIGGGLPDAKSRFSITGLGDVRGFTTDGTYLYWTSTSHSYYIGRANIDGTNVDSRWLDTQNAGTIWGVTVTGSRLYWVSTAGQIGSASKLDPTDINPALVTQITDVTGEWERNQVIVVGGTALPALAPALENLSEPSVTGTPTVGQTLTATAGNWSAMPSEVVYSWQVSSDGGGTWSAAPGPGAATNAYIPSRPDVGKQVRAQVQAGATGGVLTTVYSTSETVAAPSPLPSTTLYWAGNTAVGSTWINDTTGVAIPGGRDDNISTTCSSADAFGWNSTTFYGRQDADKICQKSIDGTGSATELVDTLCSTVRGNDGNYYGLGSLYVTDEYLYYNCSVNTWIGRVDVDGQNNIRHFADGSGVLWGHAMTGDANWLYSFGGNAIYRTAIDGGSSQVIVNNTGDVRGITTDGTYLYWVSTSYSNRIGRAKLDGTDQNNTWLDTQNSGTIWGLTATGSRLYWAARTGSEGQVGSAKLDGTDVNPTLVAGITDMTNATNRSRVHVSGGTPLPTMGPALTNSAQPTISGTPAVAQTLTAGDGTWSATPSQVFYLWQVSSDSGATWSAAPGTNGQATYVPVISDIGKTVRLKVRAGAAGGLLTTAYSAATVVVAAPPAPVNDTAPTARVNGLFRIATPGAWTESTGNIAYTYQWQLSPSGAPETWVSATGPGNATAGYVTQTGDVGQYVRVMVTAFNGNTATASSASTLVAAPSTLSHLYVKSASLMADGASFQTYANPGGWGFSSNGTTNVWGSGGNIYTAPANGSTAPASIYSDGAENFYGVFIDSEYIYFTDSTVARYIHRMKIDGSGHAPTFIDTSTVTAMHYFARDAHYIYYHRGPGSGGAIGRAPITGGTGQTFVDGLPNGVAGIALDGDHVYWTYYNNAAIGRADVTGSDVQPSFIANPAGSKASEGNGGIGVDQNGIYYVIQDGANSGVGIASLDGTSSARLATVSSLDYSLAAIPGTPVGTLPVNAGGANVPEISGTAGVGNTLTASDGTWTNTPASYTYRWLVSNHGADVWTAATGATGTTADYVVPQSYGGKDLKVRVIAHNGATWSNAAYSLVVTVPAPPVNAGGANAPQISGTVTVGETLTATHGTWTNAPETDAGYAYEWQVSVNGQDGWTAALGEGGDTAEYDVDLTDDNKYLRVMVTATNAAAAVEAVSSATAQVAIPAPTSSAVPQITGTVEIGRTLTASSGTWDFATDYAYVWQSSADGSTWDAAPGSGAATSSYIVAAADAGRYLRVRVTGSNRNGSLATPSASSTRVPSPASSVVVTPPAETPAPVFSPAPGITVGEKRGEAVLTAAAPAAGADLLRGANIWVRPSSKVEYVASALPAGLKLVNGKLVATKPGTYQVTIKVKSAKGIIRMRTIKIKVG